MAAETLSLLRSGKLAGATRLDLSAGFAEFPREIFDLADSLEILNLSGNRLAGLPEDFARLRKLRVLFCSDNPFRHLPPVLGECPELTMIGFKACEIETVDAASLPPSLRWLILTNNRIQHLPDSLGRCHGLRKLMLSGNLLEHLPEAMRACENLELARLAANRFHSLPDWLLSLPKLAWLAIAGNPLTAQNTPLPEMPAIHWRDLELRALIGEGASGLIHRACWQQGGTASEVAVKLFKGGMTSDGLPASEMDAGLAAGTHPHLVGALGRVTGHPGGAAALVMPLVDPACKPLAGPPSLDTCTRDVYPPGLELDARAALGIALSVALAAKHLHARNLMHGDLYAHNVHWHPQGGCLLGDFGAASSYPATSSLAPALQQIEVLAFARLLEELLAHRAPGCEAAWETLSALRRRCATPIVADRPLFEEVVAGLQAVTA